MDLSQPRNDSVNHHINKEDYTLTYSRVDDAVAILQRLGQGALITKVDIKHAFRLCPVRKADWHLLGFKWQGLFFFDRVLPFGLRSAPFLFNRLAEALLWIVKNRANTQDLIHYLDDYFGAGPPNSPRCQYLLDTMLNTCRDLAIPIAPEKVEGPSPTMTFLGITLDTLKMTLCLPDDKLQDLLQTLPTWLHRHSCTKRELLSLIGTLSFACKCIPAGRIFLRRMIDLSTTVRKLRDTITLSDAFRLDAKWWCDFLPTWNGTASFLDTKWTPSRDLDLYTDASGTVGSGGYHAGHWFTVAWPDSLQASIEWKEMYPILVACSFGGIVGMAAECCFIVTIKPPCTSGKKALRDALTSCN
ncbi:uncharacterized protein [Ptychodera flava]|uniref:uncharacterized protein n=1 Tax=Ptychodera flava TaxID=63121 RepID=UPI00396A606A